METTAPESLLLVHHQRVQLDVLAQILESEGYLLRFAARGAEALESALRDPPDLVLIEAALPEPGGYAACRALRDVPALSEVPVLMICGRNDPVEAFRSGAVDVIEKPFRPDVLLARVGTHLALHAAHRRLAKRNVEYRHLVRVLCHDLWNPVAAMRTFVALARRADSVEEMKRHCTGVENCLSHQEAMIERVRELSAEEEGKRVSALMPVPLGDTIASAAELLDARFEAKGIQLVLPEAAALRGLSVWAEPVGLTHGVLCNLLSNAIKFSRPGSTIRVKVERDAGRCTLIVQDEGIGMPPQILERIFRIDVATSRLGTSGERGTGFGMPVAQRVVGRFGGEITVESAEQSEHAAAHGTTVRVRLRIASPEG